MQPLHGAAGGCYAATMATRRPPTRQQPTPRHVDRLTVKLQGSEPSVWRLLSVPGHLTLAELDLVNQAGMGWTNSHQHQFAIDGKLYGVPDDDGPEDIPVLPDDAYTVERVLSLDVKRFVHEYDFGDGWQHELTVQAVEQLDERRIAWPMCLAGARACPPEDVGGMGGYGDFLQALADPTHDEHDALWQWNGGPFDPNGFDLNAATTGPSASGSPSRDDRLQHRSGATPSSRDGRAGGDPALARLARRQRPMPWLNT